MDSQTIYLHVVENKVLSILFCVMASVAGKFFSSYLFLFLFFFWLSILLKSGGIILTEALQFGMPEYLYLLVGLILEY